MGIRASKCLFFGKLKIILHFKKRIAYDSLRASLRSVARMHGDRDRSKAT